MKIEYDSAKVEEIPKTIFTYKNGMHRGHFGKQYEDGSYIHKKRMEEYQYIKNIIEQLHSEFKRFIYQNAFQSIQNSIEISHIKEIKSVQDVEDIENLKSKFTIELTNFTMGQVGILVNFKVHLVGYTLTNNTHFILIKNKDFIKNLELIGLFICPLRK